MAVAVVRQRVFVGGVGRITGQEEQPGNCNRAGLINAAASAADAESVFRQCGALAPARH